MIVILLSALDWGGGCRGAWWGSGRWDGAI
jgi:hypothetical protein